eukprot:5693626-Pyramimonas_sp.AAC.1
MRVRVDPYRPCYGCIRRDCTTGFGWAGDKTGGGGAAQLYCRLNHCTVCPRYGTVQSTVAVLLNDGSIHVEQRARQYSGSVGGTVDRARWRTL